MKISAQQYARAFFDSINETAPKDHDLVMENFVKILAQNGDLGKFEEIEAEFKLIELKTKGISEAKITFAKNHQVNSGLISNLNKILDKDIQVKKQVNENLVGGVILKADNSLLDASIQTQLQSLNKELKK